MLDRLDAETDAGDGRLWSALQAWLAANADDIDWHFLEERNLLRGVLHVCVSANHRASSVWDLLEWIVQNGHGSN